jgi:hypothetical protein
MGRARKTLFAMDRPHDAGGTKKKSAMLRDLLQCSDGILQCQKQLSILFLHF